MNQKAKPIARLDAWEQRELSDGITLLCGLASGHHRLAGRRRPIRTSRVIRLDIEAGFAETVDSLYELGPSINAHVVDEEGKSAFIAIGGVSALRFPGTNVWYVLRAEELIESFCSEDLIAVIGRLLDVVLPPDAGMAEDFSGIRH